MQRLSLFAPLTCFGAASAMAASPWDGVWKLDVASSTLNPGDLAIQRRGAGYRWPGSFPYSAICDGRSRPGPDGFDLVCTQAGRRTRVVLLEHRRLFSRTTYEVTPDGRSLRAHVLEVDRYTRRSGGGQGLAGCWHGTNTTFDGPLTYVLKLRGDSLYYLDTVEGAVSTAPLDGRPAPFQDPHPDAVRWSNRRVGPRRIEGAYLLDGKPHLQEVLELSADGKTVRNWAVGNEESVFVLRKQ